jgi:putative addiction module killer protein
MLTIRETNYFKDWIKGLNDKVSQSIINARIRRLSAGNFGDTKSVGGNVFELRIDFGPGFRVYFTRRKRTVVILLCGGAKSGQSQDIETAKRIAQSIEEV